MNRLFDTVAVAGVVALTACGGGTPMMMMTDNRPAAYVQEKETDAPTPADFSCLGNKAMAEVPPTTPTMLAIEVKDFQTKAVIAGAVVDVYTTLTKVNANTPDATSTPTDAAGKTTLTVPPGFARVI